jgi:hypothetical protein
MSFIGHPNSLVRPTVVTPLFDCSWNEWMIKWPTVIALSARHLIEIKASTDIRKISILFTSPHNDSAGNGLN